MADDLADVLVRERVTSALDLARLRDADVADIARRRNVSTDSIKEAVPKAKRQVVDTLRAWDTARTGGAGSALAQFSYASQVASSPGALQCAACPEDLSAFGRFAYFIYLVQRTDSTIPALENVLHQNLPALSPESGRESVPQITLCIEVLARAYPGPLTHDENLRFTRHLIAGILRIVGIPIQTLATEIEGFYAAIDADDLATRLRQAMTAGLFDPEPTFSAQEIELVGQLVDVRLREQFEPRVRAEREWAAAPDAEVRAEARRRMEALLAPLRHEAAPVRREAYKLRSGKTDRELFRELFIEMDLGVCETTTRLDQAIRSLQAYLDHLGAESATPAEQEQYRYLSYQSWRAERMGRLYPELAALWRDDVLAGEDGPWDRGSIVRQRAIGKARLDEQLAEVSAALETARLSDGRPAADYQADPDLLANDNASRAFASSPYHGYFQKGLGVIRSVLDADEAVQVAVGHLDREQPGLAIAELTEALGLLEGMSQSVFLPTSDWAAPEHVGRRSLEALASMIPERRKTQLIVLGAELLNGKKAIFLPDSEILSGGLLPEQGLLESLGAWTPDSGFRLATAADGPAAYGRIVKDANASGNVETIRRCLYRDGAPMSSYALRVTFAVTSARSIDRVDSMPEGEEIGIGVRVYGQAGFRVVVRSERTYHPPSGPDDIGVETLDHFLVLQKVTAAGVRTELDRAAVFLGYDTPYTLELDVGPAGSGQASLRGRFSHPGGADEVSATTTGRASGTFAIYASDTVGAIFGPLSVTLSNLVAQGLPPFFAPRRGQISSNIHRLSADASYTRRHDELAGMAADLAGISIARRSIGVTAEMMGGISADGGQPIFLLFGDGATAVSLDGLDTLLDYCLALSFYLRYAVIPTRLAQAYARSGDYERAVGLLHLLYDDTAPNRPLYNIPGDTDPRRIYPALANPAETFVQTVGPDERLVRLRLGEVYLAWAEWLFRQDTADARYQARRLCERVLALHGNPDPCGCQKKLGDVVEEVKSGLPLVPDRGSNVPSDLEVLEDALAWLRDVLEGRDIPIDFGDPPGPNPGPFPDRVREGRRQHDAAVAEYRGRVQREATLERLVEKSRDLVRQVELRVAAGSPRQRSVHRSGQRATLAKAPAAAMMVAFPLRDLMFVDYGFCVPSNPLAAEQERQACRMLDLLRACVNILGFTSDLVPPFRFEALLRLARGFTDLALKSERDLLNFRQQAEQESFSLLQANSDLALSEANVDVESLSVDVAAGEIHLASLQQMQVDANAAHYDQLIREGWTSAEKLAFGAAATAAVASSAAAIPALAGSVVATGALVGMGGGAFAAASLPLWGAIAGGPGGVASAASSVSQAASMYASFERREQEWRHQLAQSQWGSALARQQTALATDRWVLAQLRRQSAELARDFAADAVQFLNNRFLNAAMWVWMQKTVREQYRTRLNYAMTMAYMAERALAFELQNAALRVVRFDYFDPGRDGLLGATQLETDLATLENLKLTFSQRRLQLTKTISLARMLPMELQIFKEGLSDLGMPAGALRFRTPMDWFDRDFPGQYLRLIKSVKVTVVALVPPIDGIRATLRNSGLSTVISGPPFRPGFQEETVRRTPESVALSAPFQSSGLFVLDYADDLLLPFEGSGVATDWVFELPPAANRFDFRSIADVLLTIDYTALESGQHRQRVVEQLGTELVADRAFSFRHQFPDQWYDLHHPDLRPPPLDVQFDVLEADFPPNTRDLTIQHVALFVATDGAVGSVELFQLDASGSSVAGGAASPTNGVFTTRQGGAPAWTGPSGLVGRSPVGRWRLKLPSTAIPHFEDGRVRDILLTITYAGQLPGWPA